MWGPFYKCIRLVLILRLYSCIQCTFSLLFSFYLKLGGGGGEAIFRPLHVFFYLDSVQSSKKMKAFRII
jgi:hypothetical protein